MLAGRDVVYLPRCVPHRPRAWASAALPPTSTDEWCLLAFTERPREPEARWVLMKYLGNSCLAPPLSWPEDLGDLCFPKHRGSVLKVGHTRGTRPVGPGRRAGQAPAQNVMPRRPLQPGSPAPECPALTSRAGDRHSSTSLLPRPSLLSGSLLWGRGLCRPCQLSSRTWMLAVPGRGPGALSWVLSIHIQPAGAGTGVLSGSPHTVPGGEGSEVPSPALPAWGPHQPLPGLWLTPPARVVALPVFLQGPHEGSGLQTTFA